MGESWHGTVPAQVGLIVHSHVHLCAQGGVEGIQLCYSGVLPVGVTLKCSAVLDIVVMHIMGEKKGGVNLPAYREQQENRGS